MTIILEGLNVGKANLQPESMCAFKFFRVTIGDMRTYHKKITEITKHFSDYFRNFCVR